MTLPTSERTMTMTTDPTPFSGSFPLSKAQLKDLLSSCDKQSATAISSPALAVYGTTAVLMATDSFRIMFTTTPPTPLFDLVCQEPDHLRVLDRLTLEKAVKLASTSETILLMWDTATDGFQISVAGMTLDSGWHPAEYAHFWNLIPSSDTLGFTEPYHLNADKLAAACATTKAWCPDSPITCLGSAGGSSRKPYLFTCTGRDASVAQLLTTMRVS